MTRTARVVVLAGTTLFTAGTISWILTGNWQWFAGGIAILLGTIIAGGILSVEVKQSRNDLDRNYQPPPPPPVNKEDDDWGPPTASTTYRDPFTESP